jgi:predicted RNA binding protein YcfA (HicA-like mRNA interferase family)
MRSSLSRWRSPLPKLGRFSGREIRRLLESHGFVFIRQRGSHMVMQLALSDTTVTAIVPDHAELRTGTLRSIIRQSKLPKELFETES